MEPTGFLARKGWKLRHESPIGSHSRSHQKWTEAEEKRIAKKRKELPKDEKN